MPEGGSFVQAWQACAEYIKSAQHHPDMQGIHQIAMTVAKTSASFNQHKHTDSHDL